MKINLEVVFDECKSVESMREKIIEECAENLLDRVIWTKFDSSSDTLETRVENRTYQILKSVLDKELKESITQRVTEEFLKKYDRSKEARELKEEYRISSDAQIKESLKGIIETMVAQEIRRKFK